MSRFTADRFRDEFLIAFQHLPMSRALHNVPQVHWNAAVLKYIDNNFPDDMDDFLEDFVIDRNGRVVYFPDDAPAGAEPDTFIYGGNVDLMELFGYLPVNVWRHNRAETARRLMRWLAIDQDARAEMQEFFGF